MLTNTGLVKLCLATPHDKPQPLFRVVSQTSRSATVRAFDAREGDSLLSVQCLQDETAAITIFTVIRACSVPGVVQWLHELQAVKEDIAISDNCTGGYWRRRQFDL
jgi:hypothetical protein